MDVQTNHYTWLHVPNHHRTKKQLLKRHRRLKKNAQPVGTFTNVFDKPRFRPKYTESVPPDDCEQLRQQFQHFGPGQGNIYRLDQAGHLVTSNLYDLGDTEPITAFTEREATKLLEYMVWDHSHEDHYITEATVDGKRQRSTWKSEISPPNLTTHLAGERYFGVKKGGKTMQVTVDCDRHGGDVPGDLHIAKTLKVGQVLTRRFPHLRFAPEVNSRNGSVKFFGWLANFLPIAQAEGVAEEVRSALQQELPEYDFNGLEIYPSSSPQIFAPLRADKLTVIGTGVLEKVKKYRMEKYNGKRRRVYYEAHSCAGYLNWIYFSDTQYNEQVFEQVLREAVARCPDKPAAHAKPAAEKKTTRKKGASTGGMGSVGGLKGRCASALVRFWSELDVPEDDTIGKYVIVTLRILKYERLSSDEAVEWVEDRLQALEYTEFSDRLTDNFEELRRVMAYAVEAIWNKNGYQKDPVTSEAKLKATVEAWSKRGFKLHDPATWHKHQQAVVPELKLVWTVALLGVIPELEKMAHCSHDQAKAFIEKVLAFVEANNELAESMVGNLLEEVGIRGKGRQKQHDVRKFLVDKSVLLKQKNYFSDPDTGYRHGNFYVCGLGVRFEEEIISHTPHSVSISYLSVAFSPVDSTSEDWLDFVMEDRRMACDRRYGERLRQLKMLFSRAA